MQPSWFRTDRHIKAEEQVRGAIRIIADARTVLTIWELEEFIRENVDDLGGRGFVGSIGKAMSDGATVDLTRTETAQQQLTSNETNVNEQRT